MERLTKRIDGGIERVCRHYPEKEKMCYGCVKRTACNADLFDRLAYYEDMEEQGWLVVLPPIKIGDTAFFVIKGHIYEAEICILQWYKHSRGVITEIRGNTGGGSVSASFSDWGKTVFLTREEAENALKGGAN